MGACCSVTKSGTPVDNYADNFGGLDGGVTLAPMQSSYQMEGEILQSSNLKQFQLSELEQATKNFHSDQMKGQGEFGHVFMGKVGGTTVAVKKLDTMGSEGQQEWLTEIKNLGHLYHPNLVKLIGYCSEGEHRILVYEFVANGSLESNLFGASHTCPLSWDQRMKIAHGSAKGLAFLHQKADVIYRDFRTSNILLDSGYNAKLCDFGFARDAPTDDKTHVTTRVVGSYEYMAPEYNNEGHASSKSDVYSFGVVLLEMMTGKKAMDPRRRSEERNLVKWARTYLTNTDHPKISKLLDAKLKGKVSSTDLLKAANLVSVCLSEDPRSRPDMPKVVKELESLLAGQN